MIRNYDHSSYSQLRIGYVDPEDETLYQEARPIDEETEFVITIRKRIKADPALKEFDVIMDCALIHPIAGEVDARQLYFSNSEALVALPVLANTALSGWEWLIRNGYGGKLKLEGMIEHT